MSATLYIVATPIGNLQDISLRAQQVLADVDVIACEDTRHSGVLLQHYAIKTPTLSLHEHNERARVEQIVARLEQGQSVALISDAGTPLISDPGFYLVRQVSAAGFAVVPVPGACAAIAALSASGLPTDRFYFAGFLPAKGAVREKALLQLAEQTATLILYESPRRLHALLELLNAQMPERQVVVARELTKQYESFYRGTAADLLVQDIPARGECVVVVEGARAQADEILSAAIKTLSTLLEELSVKQAVQLTCRLHDASRKVIYQKALEISGK